MDWTEGPYKISRDKSLLSLDRICELLATSYWADKRSKEAIAKSIEHSICYGLYCDGEQIGFGRVVTDYATMYYLCDVIVADPYRGQGLGKKLVEYIIGSEELRPLIGVLATKDAHSLYQQYGFAKNEERFMFRMPSR